VKEFTHGRGADVIYDSVGGDVFDRSLKCIAWNGRLLVIGFAGGQIPSVAANRILLKNVSVVGLHWGAYAKYEPQRIPETFAALFKLYEEKKINNLSVLLNDVKNRGLNGYSYSYGKTYGTASRT